MNKNTLLTYVNLFGLVLLATLWFLSTADIYDRLGALQNATIDLSDTIYNLTVLTQNTTSLLADNINYLYNYIQYIENSVKENITKLQSDINYVKYKVKELNENMSNILNTLSWIRNWLKSSYISFESFKSEFPLVTQCVKGNIVNMPCVFYILTEKYGFSYILDNKTFGKDTLLTPNQYIENKGGDCEDIAFFYTVLLADLKKKGYNIYIMEYSPGSEVFLEETSYGYRYYPDFRTVYIDLNDYYIYTLCYIKDIFSEGHCIIGLCKEPLTKPNTEAIIDNCILIEPQHAFAKYDVSKYNGTIYIDDGITNDTIVAFDTVINSTTICMWDICVKSVGS